MAPRRRCPVCQSKQWHKERGLITCSEGHVLQNYRNETTEVTELGPHAVRKRTLRSGKKKRERPSKADPKLYHGERARYHYFQCLQLVLRLQIASLTRLWHLPPEFEIVCRDLWALHLALLPNPPVPEPLLHMQDGQVAGEASTDRTGGHMRTEETTARSDEDEQSDHSRSSQDSPSPSNSSSSSVDLDHDSELEELMRENSESSSTDDDDIETSKHNPGNVPRPTRKPTFGEFDGLSSTIVVLIVACWNMRIPIMYMDIVRLIEDYELPYLDVIALRLIPDDMTSHLRKHTTQALSPHNAPKPALLHRLTSRLAKLLHTTYDVYTPELNAAPILWKAVRSLQGTPTLYVLTKNLARLVSIPLTLHRSLAPTLARIKRRDPTFHKHDSAIPEVALVAAVIVVMKMVYGLDGQPRGPVCETDPGSALPNLPDLLSAIRDANLLASQSMPPSSSGKERSALDMDETSLDDYLQFCTKALLPRGEGTTARNVTTDHFPVRVDDAGSESREEKQEQFTLAPNLWRPLEEMLKPGEQYLVYNTQDILGSLPDDMEDVISTAARWAGVDDDYVAAVVERFERRVIRWWDMSGKASEVRVASTRMSRANTC